MCCVAAFSMRSKKFNEARLEKMKMRDEVVMKCKQAAADRLMAAIEAVTANPRLHTRDLGGLATTAQVTAAVCEKIA